MALLDCIGIQNWMPSNNESIVPKLLNAFEAYVVRILCTFITGTM